MTTESSIVLYAILILRPRPRMVASATLEVMRLVELIHLKLVQLSIDLDVGRKEIEGNKQRVR